MKIKILPIARQFNCHWYCTEIGKIFDVKKFDDKLNCYMVLINKIEHLIYKTHAEIVI